MTLPVSTILPIAYSVQPLNSRDGFSPKSSLGAELTDRPVAALEKLGESAPDERSQQFVVGTAMTKGSLNDEASVNQSPRRIPIIQGHADGGEWIELPVSVTEILRIKLDNALVDPIASTNAKALYGSIQNLFAQGNAVPSSPGAGNTVPKAA